MKKTILSKRLIALLLAFVMSISLVACGSDSSPDTQNSDKPSSGQNNTDIGNSALEDAADKIGTSYSGAVYTEPVVDKLTYGLRNASWDFSPWKNNGSSMGAMWLLVYSNLLANPGFGSALEDMQLDMAESYTISDDQLTATVKLRDYIHDSKGNPIKAEDVVFSYETAPNVGPLYAKLSGIIESVTAVDEYTVELKIAAATPGIWATVLSDCPIVSKAWYESASDEEKAMNPASTGTYKVVENAVGTKAVLTVVEDFWQKDELRTVYQSVNATTLEFICIVEESMRAIALENGEVDAVYLDAASYSLFADDPQYTKYSAVMSQPVTLVLNCSEESPLSDNLALRKAIMHALDFDQMEMAHLGGFSVSGNDLGHPLCSDYNKEWDNEPYFQYDVDLAKQYMKEAGYDPANSGLTLKFLCRNMSGIGDAAVVAQANLAAIGIKLEICAYDQSLYDTYLRDPAQWDLAYSSLTVSSGTVTESWNSYLGVQGDHGTLGFVKDDKLQSLLKDAMSIHDDASIEAFHDYSIEQAYAAQVCISVANQFSHSYLTDTIFNFMGGLQINTAVVSEEYIAAH